MHVLNSSCAKKYLDLRCVCLQSSVHHGQYVVFDIVLGSLVQQKAHVLQKYQHHLQQKKTLKDASTSKIQCVHFCFCRKFTRIEDQADDSETESTHLNWFLYLEERHQSREDQFGEFLLSRLFRQNDNTGQNERDHVLVDGFLHNAGENPLESNSLKENAGVHNWRRT